MEVEQQEVVNNVMCQLTDPEGNPLGKALYLPQDAGPLQLMELVNSLLKNEEKLPYAFYISDEELVLQIGSYLQKKKHSWEVLLLFLLLLFSAPCKLDRPTSRVAGPSAPDLRHGREPT